MSAARVHDEVADALRAARPVVALESAVVTSGLPRDALGRAPRCAPHDWRADQPVNLETARTMAQAVRNAGAVPAMVAVIRGELRIGLDEGELASLANDQSAGKVSRSYLSHTMATGATAGTTVSATLHVCAIGADWPIRVMATGGIGGVHRGWTKRPDISADLATLAGTPVCLVCSGAKSILDLPATLEALETLGVPVIGHGTDWLPQFVARGQGRIPLPRRIDDARQAAQLCHIHWTTLRLSGGVLIANPVPPAFALADEEADEIDRRIESMEASDRAMMGERRTPRLLAAVAAASGGRSVEANIALLIANARLAAHIAVELTSSSPLECGSRV